MQIPWKSQKGPVTASHCAGVDPRPVETPVHPKFLLRHTSDRLRRCHLFRTRSGSAPPRNGTPRNRHTSPRLRTFAFLPRRQDFAIPAITSMTRQKSGNLSKQGTASTVFSIRCSFGGLRTRSRGEIENTKLWGSRKGALPKINPCETDSPIDSQARSRIKKPSFWNLHTFLFTPENPLPKINIHFCS